MTRGDFINNVTTWDELKDFCYDYDCDYLSDVYDECGLDEYLDDKVEDWAHYLSWEQLRDRLNEVPIGGDWYRINEYDDVIVLDDDDFEAYKDDVLAWADEDGVWSDDDDIEEYEVIEDEEEDLENDDDDIVEEPFSLFELYDSCQNDIANAKTEEENKEKESDDALKQFIVGVDFAKGA